jgi:hypothetical protein
MIICSATRRRRQASGSGRQSRVSKPEIKLHNATALAFGGARASAEIERGAKLNPR